MLTFTKNYKLITVLSITTLMSVSFLLLLPTKSSALNGSQFEPGRIIDDQVFYESSSMNTSQIQYFLDSKVPSCDTNGTQPYKGTTRATYGASRGYPAPYTCLKNYSESIQTRPGDAYCGGTVTGGNKSSAQIIYDVAQACGVNPKVLLVLLQKEQSLVTDDWPWSIQYRSATGYGCPDTAPCDSEYYGFFNQVYQAARAYKRYRANPTNYNYRAGRNNTILWNPNSGCGTSEVYIENQATAGLYIYTPYRPNQAALDNLYGTGDSCSSYGNRNFWRIFNDWFGNTHGNLKGIAGDGGGMAASSWTDTLDLFVRGTNITGANMWTKSFNDWSWSSFQQDPPNNESVRISSQVSAVSWGYGRIDLFARSENGSLIHKWYQNIDGWSSWEDLGGCIIGTPTATSWSPNRLDIFVQGCNSTGINMYHKWWDQNYWHNWEVVPALNARISDAPSATSWGPGRIDVFARSENGELIHNWFDRRWYGIESQGGCIIGQPAVSAWSPGRLDIFVQGCNNTGANVWHKFYDDNTWRPWEITPMHQNTRITSMLGAVSWSPNRIDIFGRGENGSLMHQWFDGSWWPWESLGGDIAE